MFNYQCFLLDFIELLANRQIWMVSTAFKTKVYMLNFKIILCNCIYNFYCKVCIKLWKFLFHFRNLYETFVEEMIISPGSKVKAVSRIDVTLDDHVSLILILIRFYFYFINIYIFILENIHLENIHIVFHHFLSNKFIFSFSYSFFSL